jgi:hypothetical protein
MSEQRPEDLADDETCVEITVRLMTHRETNEQAVGITVPGSGYWILKPEEAWALGQSLIAGAKEIEPSVDPTARRLH